MPLKCMFDTVVFNRIVDGKLCLDSIRDLVTPYATHIQRDELQNTPDETRRSLLMQAFHDAVTDPVATETFVFDLSRLDEAKMSKDGVVHTSSAVWGVSKWGQAMWSGEESMYSALRTELDGLNGGKRNNTQDALIAETAIRGGYVLITDDGHLATATKKHNGSCLSVQELGQLKNE